MTSSIFIPTPWCLDDIEPHLYVYRRGKPDRLVIPHTLNPPAAVKLLETNGFLSTCRITFVTHGFRNTVEIPWVTEMKEELLKEEDQTVILIGWGKGADLMAARYLQAAANIQTVGGWLSGYIVALGNWREDVRLWGIGHSLGCHLLGIAGRQSQRLDRISAMDPAGPAFEKHAFVPYRLCPTDAKFVDVIHTDGYDSFLDPEDWISPVNHYGTLIPLGTIDFYPNYGYDQPGAGPVTSHLIAASHLRAIDLFLWSIAHPEKFRTHQALDGIPAFESPVTKLVSVTAPAEMGYHAFKAEAKEGVFYVQTNKAEPWVNHESQPECDSLSRHGACADLDVQNHNDAAVPKVDEVSRSYCSVM